MEERYKKYIDKAKSVIKTLDPKHNPNAPPEVSALKVQLEEKDKVIEGLERETEKAKVNLWFVFTKTNYDNTRLSERWKKD